MTRAADIQTQWRDDPSTSRAEKLAQLDKNPNNLRAGQERVLVNMRTTLGGFASFRRATETQKAVAMRFKNAHDNGMVGGASAIKPQEKVSGGGQNPELAFIIGEDARRDWLFAQTILGAFDFMILEDVIIKEKTARDLAKKLPAKFGDNMRTGRRNASKAIYAALDKLAVGWDLASVDVV